MVEDNRIYKFFAELNVEFDEVRGRIISRHPFPSIGEVFAEVRREESRRLVMLGKKNTEEPLENYALAVTDATANKVNYQRRADEKPRVWCDYCNKPRHTRETCWKLNGKPVNWKNSKPGDKTIRTVPSANEVDSGPFNKEQMDHLLKLIKSNSLSGSIPNVSLAQTGNALSCSNYAPWIIDSRASDHMTSFSHFFTTYSPCSSNEKFRIADGSFSPFAGKGLIKIF